MYSYGPPHMAERGQEDQLEHTYSSYVRIRDVALRTCQRRWTIWRSDERESKISVLAARHDDDDDDVKGLAKRIQKICSPSDIRTIFTSGLTLQRYLFHGKLPTEFNRTKNCCGKVYKGKTCHLLKARLEHQKAVVWGEIEKLSMVNHKWKEKENHLPLWDEVRIIDKEEHWRLDAIKN